MVSIQVSIGNTMVPFVNNMAILRGFKGNSLDNLEVIILVDMHNEMGTTQLMGPYKQYKSTEYIFNESFNALMNQFNNIFGGNE